MKKINYQKEIPIKKEYDIIVAGSGPAGLCAAVAAARHGATVALVERYGVIGGNLTVGFVGPILGMVGKGTMRDEIMELLGVPENDMIGRTGRKHDIERAKAVLEDFIDKEENVEVYLQSTVSDVLMDGNIIKGILVAGNEGQYALTSHIVIDATGDANVCFYAGCEIAKGREDGLLQPVTLEFTIDGVDEKKGIICIGDVDDVTLNGERFLDYCKRCAEKGILPENLAAVRLHPTTIPGQRQVNTTQVNRIDITKTEQIFLADVELRRQIGILMEFFRRYLPGYENCRCISSGDTTGVRESRRVLGDYILTGEDVEGGRRFEDVIVHKAEFIVDIHNPTGSGQAEKEICYCKPYDIPYRCLVPRGIENLYVAGRGISGTHRAHASYRVMSICMAMGEAAGIAADLCVKKRCLPRNLDVKRLQDVMLQDGIDLFSE